MGKSLIIKGANFAANAIPEEVIIDTGVYSMVNKCTLSSDSNPYIKDQNSRGMVLITRESASNPKQWPASGSGINTTLQGLYSMICVPAGAESVTIKITNSSYYYGLSLWNATTRLYDSGWVQGGNAITLDLTNYPTGVYITSTLKIGTGGTTSFSTETLESIGWSIEWH